MWPFKGKNKAEKVTSKKDEKCKNGTADVKNNNKENKKDKKEGISRPLMGFLLRFMYEIMSACYMPY